MVAAGRPRASQCEEILLVVFQVIHYCGVKPSWLIAKNTSHVSKSAIRSAVPLEPCSGGSVTMARVSDEDGAHGADHLPLLLMSMQATACRVAPKSPAAVLFGWELRLPAQLADMWQGHPNIVKNYVSMALSQLCPKQN